MPRELSAKKTGLSSLGQGRPIQALAATLATTAAPVWPSSVWAALDACPAMAAAGGPRRGRRSSLGSINAPFEQRDRGWQFRPLQWCGSAELRDRWRHDPLRRDDHQD